MKKIFILAIAAMLCCVMLIPVSADTFNGVELPSTDNLSENIDLDTYKYQVILYDNSDSVYYLYLCENPIKPNSTGNSLSLNSCYSFYWRNGESKWRLNRGLQDNYSLKFQDNGWVIVWANEDIYTSDGNLWFDGVKECDGTSCPATDANKDNICDDCGMMFAVLRYYPPDTWLSQYPFTFTESNADYYIYKVVSTGRTYLVEYPNTETPTYYANQKNGVVIIENYYNHYEYNESTGAWVVQNKQDQFEVGGFVNGAFSNVYSSAQIVYENGDNFFPIPLWEEMDNLTQGEMEALRPNLGGVMMILTLCGVGCLALVIVLSLFGKRSLISRS